MQNMAQKIVFLLAAFIATSAQAQGGSLYFGLDALKAYGATWKIVNTPDEKLSVGTPIKLTLGYAFNDRYALEAGVFSVKASKGAVSESIKIVPVNLVYNIPLSTQTGILLKGGLAPFRAKFNHPSYDSSDFLIGLSLGAGIKHQLSQSVDLVGGVDFLNGYRVKLENKNQYDLSPANAYLGLRIGL
jgi:hypothetical protein